MTAVDSHPPPAAARFLVCFSVTTYMSVSLCVVRTFSPFFLALVFFVVVGLVSLMSCRAVPARRHFSLPRTQLLSLSLTAHAVVTIPSGYKSDTQYNATQYTKPQILPRLHGTFRTRRLCLFRLLPERLRQLLGQRRTSHRVLGLAAPTTPANSFFLLGDGVRRNGRGRAAEYIKVRFMCSCTDSFARTQKRGEQERQRKTKIDSTTTIPRYHASHLYTQVNCVSTVVRFNTFNLY